MCAVWMDLHESKKGSEKQSSSAETTRPPLIPADNKDGTTRRSRTREVSSRYRSPSPSAPKRSPSPSARRTSSISTAPVPKRAVSAERKRPSTPVRDTGVETPLASRKTAGNKLPESLWPSTMRSLSASFQSDTVSVSKKERTVSQRMPTPEKKRSPLQGKNSTDQLHNSKSVVDQHLWPGRTSGILSTSLNRSDVIDKMNKNVGSSHSRIVAPSSRRSSLDGISKTTSLIDSRTSAPSGRRLSLDGTSETSSLSDSRTSTPSGRRLSLDGTSKTSSLSESRTTTSGRRLSLDGTSKASSLSESRTSTPSGRRLSLNGTSKISSLSESRTSTPSGRRLSLDGTSKASSSSNSRTGTASGRRLSLDGTSKASSLSESRISTPSGRRLSLDGTSEASSLSESRMSTPSGRRLSLDGTSKASSLSESRTSTPSGRRLSLDGTSKASSLTDSRTSTLCGRRLSLDGTTKASSLTDSRMSTPSGRRLSVNGTSKASSLSDSRTSTPSGRRLSLDGASKPSQKSANDLLLIISRDGSEKDFFTSSFDDDLLRIRRPSSSSSSSDRTSLVNGAARVQSMSRPTSISVSRAKSVYPSSRGTSPVRVRPSSPSAQPQDSTSVLSFIADIKQGRKAATNIDDVHQLRLLYNRHLQWLYANARRDAAFRAQKAKAERMLYKVSRIIADLCDSVKEKRCDLLQLKFKLKLYSALDNQLTCLDGWASIEGEHDNSLMLAIQDLEASTLRVPITGGAMVDIKSLGATVYSAVDVMQAIGSSLWSTLAQVEERNHSVGELADVASHERAMLDECESLLSCTTALLVEEHSLRTQVLQMKQT